MDNKHLKPRFVNYDRVVYSQTDRLPVLFIKRLFRFMGRAVNLHKIVWPDEWDCFHSHPARWSISIVLWGGYVEERYDGTMHKRRVGSIQLIRNDHIHRINRLLHERPSYSLWIRGKIRYPTFTWGDGWPAHMRGVGHKSGEE